MFLISVFHNKVLGVKLDNDEVMQLNQVSVSSTQHRILMFPYIESVDVIAQLPTQINLSLHKVCEFIPDGLDNSLFSHTSDKTRLRSVQAFVCAFHKGKSQRSSGTCAMTVEPGTSKSRTFLFFLIFLFFLSWLQRID